MPKKIKKEKSAPNIIVFLVEGDSDQIALEHGLSELFFSVSLDYEIRFLQQQRIVNSSGDEMDDSVEEDNGDDLPEDEEYKFGGDITTSSYVTPNNIETKIANRFIKPAVKEGGGFYEKRIAKIIQIVDLDGAYLTDDQVVPLSADRSDWDGIFYNTEDGVIETQDREKAIDRNERKRKNLDYLISLTENGIKIKTHTIPYEIYFFSSNLDHFINKDANMKCGKRAYADRFNRTYGLFTEKFCKYFLDDPDSIGHMGYYESWDEIKQGVNSVKRFTNIDCLIKKLQSEAE